jgi:hypothetical protein
LILYKLDGSVIGGASGFRSIPAAGAGSFGKQGAVFHSIPIGGAGGVEKGSAFHSFYSRRERTGWGGRGAKGPASGRVSCAGFPSARITDMQINDFWKSK